MKHHFTKRKDTKRNTPLPVKKTLPDKGHYTNQFKLYQIKGHYTNRNKTLPDKTSFNQKQKTNFYHKN